MVATAILGGPCLSPGSMPRQALRGVMGPRRSRVRVVVALVGIQFGRPAGSRRARSRSGWRKPPAPTGSVPAVVGVGRADRPADEPFRSPVQSGSRDRPATEGAPFTTHSHGVVRSRCRPVHDVRCEAVHPGDTACGQDIRCTRRRGESLRSRGWGPVRPSGSGGGSLPNSHRRWPCMPQFACRVRQSVLAHLLEEGLGAGGWVRLPGSARVVVSGSDLHRCASHCSHSRPTHDQ